MMRTIGRLRPIGPVLAITVLLAARPALSQEPDTTAVAPARGNCVLTWRGAGADEPRTTSTQVSPGVYTHYVSGRMLWMCGNATMEADSAVHLENRRQVDLIGNVVYVDSLRTLRSRLLTYFELQDLVIAREEVELVRLSDGSRLTGPHVEFLRAVSGVDEVTTAIGRPHMTLVPSGDEAGPPLEIDADRAVFAGEEEARAYGDVVLQREDLDGEADSLRMLRAEERGTMWGSPWIEARNVRLEGDEIEFRSENEQLTDVHAVGNGHAVGESFEVRAARIDIAMAEEEPERVWAHGEGLGEALSGDHRLYGDSLEFALHAGTIDTSYAIGEAVAIQGGEDVALGLSGATSPDIAAADSLAAVADSLTVPADSLAAVADSLIVPADSLAAPADSMAPRAPPPGGVDSLAAADPVGAAPDTAALAADSLAAPADSSASAAASGWRGPSLSVHGSANWVRGDTVIAIFERAAAPDSATAALAEESVAGAAADSIAAAETLAEAALAATDSLTGLDAPSAPADSADDPLMERLIAIGQARAFYSAVRDSARSRIPSRNYMIGSRIDLYFSEGEPVEVVGVEAVGVFLEPEEGPPGVDPEAAGRADSLDVPPDSLAVPPDSLAVPPDSLAVPPDSLAVPPDSASVDRRWADPGALRTAGRGGPRSEGEPGHREWAVRARGSVV